MTSSRSFADGPPRVFQVAQSFPRPRVVDPSLAVQEALEGLLPRDLPHRGASIGVTVGSRGIAQLPTIVKATIDFLRSRGAEPFILPAMGSHGGATSEGQRRVLEDYGIGESSMGAPVKDSMRTRSLGRTADGVEAFAAESALESDGIILLNRVKPHTDFKGPIESGLSKICALGLGKYEGAREYHSHFFGIGLGTAIQSAAERVIATGKILGGLAILENAYHETARIEGVPVEGFFATEERLLEEARGLMPRLPLGELDVLVCERVGKDISGTGIDTNIVGRGVHGHIEGVPWQHGMPIVWRIVALDLTQESRGNAVGMGLLDFATERFAAKVDRRITNLNAIAASAPGNGKMPIILENDREAIRAALATSPRREGGPLLALIRDTLDLGHAALSEACLPFIEGRGDIEILSEPRPLRFDDSGRMISPLP